jgi:hypothetical protein
MNTSIDELPLDILEHQILTPLAISSPSFSTIGSFVCRRWKKIVARARAQLLAPNQHTILRSLFKEGYSLEFLGWVENRVSFPIWQRPSVSFAKDERFANVVHTWWRSNFFGCVALSASGHIIF